jgi:hypothetical protein
MMAEAEVQAQREEWPRVLVARASRITTSNSQAVQLHPMLARALMMELKLLRIPTWQLMKVASLLQAEQKRQAVKVSAALAPGLIAGL